MTDQGSGIDLMRRRMERAARRPPPPRRSQGAVGPPAAVDATGATRAAPAAGPARVVTPATSTSTPPARREPATRATATRLAPDLPPVNLAIRVRKPLDDRLAELIYALRREGVRTSKVELIEMLLWELPEGDTAGARERLRRFRSVAARGPGAPLEEG